MTALAMPVETFAAIEANIDAIAADRTGSPVAAAGDLLALGELVLERWLISRGEVPTRDQREGFRLLALHRQGAKGDPSFNACRETCRELCYHYNLITMEPDHPEVRGRIAMAAMVTKHLVLFIGGKLEVAGLGEFCCSSRALRRGDTVRGDGDAQPSTAGPQGSMTQRPMGSHADRRSQSQSA